jgi:SpoVK/Ycf46/Vps4 family AAA+-type ATPase
LPGTGKSLVALTVARELLADCYELNLHRLIATGSPQTEQDLTMLLAAVDAGHIVLHVESAELLTAQTGPALATVASWLERATGVVLLSTTTAFVRLDPALLRRIKIEVAIPFPDEGMRAEIWRRHLPSDCDVDVAALAKHALTGRAIVQTIERGQIIARVHGHSLPTDVMSAAILERIDEPIRR